MFKQTLKIVISLALALIFGPFSHANIYQGYEQIGTGQIDEIPTKGTMAEGLRHTMLSQLLKGPSGEDLEVEIEGDLVGRVKDTGSLLEYFNRKYYLKIKHQKKLMNFQGKVHLVMVIPGFGASNSEGAGPYLSELLHRQGLLTVTSHSPAHPQFVLESSTNGAPGYQLRDAKDLYKQLQEVMKILKSQYEYNITQVSIVGASLGAVNVTLMAKLDQQKKLRFESGNASEKPIDFHRVVAINPPISNVYGGTVIDTSVAKTVPGADRFDFSERLAAYHDGLELLLDKRNVVDFDDVGPQSLKALGRMSKQADDSSNLKFLVGFGFASTVRDATQSFELRWWDDLVSTIRIDRTTMPVRFFTHFLKSITIPYSFNAEHYGSSPSKSDLFPFDEIIYPQFVINEEESVGQVIQSMQNHAKMDLSHYHLVTWDDDLLLRVPAPGYESEFIKAYGDINDADWIQKTLSGGTKGQSKVFTLGGGHLGGYYQEAFQQYLVQSLQ